MQQKHKAMERLSQMGGSEEIGREQARGEQGQNTPGGEVLTHVFYACHLTVNVAIKNSLLQSGQ